jgi:hypothetical protein
MFRTYFRASCLGNDFVENVQYLVKSLRNGVSCTKLEAASAIFETFVEVKWDFSQYQEMISSSYFIPDDNDPGKLIQIAIKDSTNDFINRIPAPYQMRKPMKFNAILEWMSREENKSKYLKYILFKAMDLEQEKINYYTKGAKSKYKFLF